MKQVSALFFCLMMMTMSLSGCFGSDDSKVTIEGTFDGGRDSGEIWDSFESEEGEELSFSVVELETCVRDDDDPTQPEEYPCRTKDVVIKSTCVGGLGDYTTLIASSTLVAGKGDTIGGSGLECNHDLVGLYEEGYLNATWRFIIDINAV